MKIINYDHFLKQELKRPGVKKEYDALKEEYNVAAQLIELRQKAGLSQRELAKKIKTSQPCIARLESGRYQNVSMRFLRKVSNALGVEPHIKFQKLKTVRFHW
jgi:ribosome-binding protein aMBF1 (putative translation factor)